MDDSDEYISVDSGSSTVKPTQDNSQITEGPPVRKSSRESVKKKPRCGQMVQARIPKDLRSVNAMKRHITKVVRGHDIDYNLSLRVLGAALELQRGYLQTLSRVRKEKKKEV